MDAREIEAMIRRAIAEAIPSAKVGVDAGMVLTPIYPPLGSVPESTRFLMPRDFVLTFNFVANQVTTLSPPLDFGEPAMIYGLSATARNGDGTAAALRNFEYQAVSSSERYNSVPTLVDGIFGAGAGNMRLIGGRGWQFIPNLQITATATNLLPAVTCRLDLVYHAILLRQ